MTPSPHPFATAVVIGRWQIFHNGHLRLLRAALERCQDVIVVVGSAWRARDVSNPFSYAERAAMVRAALSDDEAQRVRFLPIRDYADDDRWVRVLQEAVARMAPGSAVDVVGFEKDASSYYLRKLAPWTPVRVAEKFSGLDATPLRAVYFDSADLGSALAVLAPHVPRGVLAYLHAWGQLPVRQECARQRQALRAYRKRWTADFSVAADAVVRVTTAEGVQVLLVRRKGPIGAGLWALPGGFVNKDELTLDAALRELKEETGVDIWKPQALECLRERAVFDDPRRSARGRIISHAYLFDLGSPRQLPEVRAGDDAAEARWVPVSGLPDLLEQLFEDHALILERFLGALAEPAAALA